MTAARTILTEAIRTARADWVVTLCVSLVVGGVCAALMLASDAVSTSDRRVLAAVDPSRGAALIARTDSPAGWQPQTLARIRAIDGVSAVFGLGRAVDAVNSRIPGGARVPVRPDYTCAHERQAPHGLARASASALAELGMIDGVGSVTLVDSGLTVGVVAAASTPPALRDFEPLVRRPACQVDADEPMTVIVVAARSARDTLVIADRVPALLAAHDPTQVHISTSAGLAALRERLAAQLDISSHVLAVGMLGAEAFIIAVLNTFVVIVRRREFGRRRALGASVSWIMRLQLAQAGLTGGAAVMLGSLVGIVALMAGTGQSPRFDAVVANGVLTLSTVLLASWFPALLAARRDPVRELRSP